MIAPLMAALLLQSAGDTTTLMRPGVSRALAAHRANAISDVRYVLKLDLTRLDTARGHVQITFALSKIGDVVVDFRGSKLSAVTINDVATPNVEWNGTH